MQYNMSYIYHSMASYFDRDNVSLPGLAKYFREQSLEERGHAQRLIDFQNTRYACDEQADAWRQQGPLVDLGAS